MAIPLIAIAALAVALSQLGAGPTTNAEQYCYSTAWLLFGIALLAAGFFPRSQPARLLALGVVALTIAKVFIIDTASISGIYGRCR